MPKVGPIYDLAIALGLLLASGQIQAIINNSVCVGELSLDGSVRPSPGILPIALMATKHGLTDLYLAAANAQEATMVNGLRVYGVASLKTLIGHLPKSLAQLLISTNRIKSKLNT